MMREHFKLEVLRLTDHGEHLVSIKHIDGGVMWRVHTFDGEAAWCENMTPLSEAKREAEYRCELLNRALDPYDIDIDRAKSHGQLAQDAR